MTNITVEIIGSGPKGDNGITPTKGVDYFTTLEKDEMVQREDEITGIHYRTGVSNGVIFMEEV